MYNKKVLSKAVKNLGSAKAPAKKKDMIVDPMGQWKHPGQNTRIPGNNITMQGVPYPVWAVPNVGAPQMMYPEQDYQFPGADYVDEYPMARRGGALPKLPKKKNSKGYSKSLTATNKLFAQSPLTKKAKSKKNKIFDPQSKYYQDGGISPLEGNYISNVIMNRNRGTDFVDRAYALGANPGTPMFNVPDDEMFGAWMSHKMATGEDDSGQTWMFPTVLNPNDEAIKVPNQYADYISSEGYKYATGMKQKGGFQDDINKHRKLLRDWTYGASIGMLHKAQQGVVISDPEEYKYRKAMYDDSLALYNAYNLFQNTLRKPNQTVSILGDLQGRNQGWGPKILPGDPYARVRPTKEYTYYQGRQPWRVYKYKKPVQPVFEAPEIGTLPIRPLPQVQTPELIEGQKLAKPQRYQPIKTAKRMQTVMEPDPDRPGKYRVKDFRRVDYAAHFPGEGWESLDAPRVVWINEKGEEVTQDPRLNTLDLGNVTFQQGGLVKAQKGASKSEEKVQEIPEQTVYGNPEKQKTQKNLIQEFQKAKKAYQDWRENAGLTQQRLRNEGASSIKSLRTQVANYKKELEEERKAYRKAEAALNVLKKQKPDEWKNAKLNDVLSGKGINSLRNLYAQGKISEQTYRDFYNSFGSEYDPNVVEGKGSGAQYSAKEAEENWMENVPEFVSKVNALATAIPLAGAAGALAPAAGTVGRAAWSLMENPYVQGAYLADTLVNSVPESTSRIIEATKGETPWSEALLDAGLTGLDLALSRNVIGQGINLGKKAFSNYIKPTTKTLLDVADATGDIKPASSILSDYRSIEELRLANKMKDYDQASFSKLYPSKQVFDQTKKEATALLKKYKSEFTKKFGKGTDEEILLYGAHKELENLPTTKNFLANDEFAQSAGLNTDLTNQQKFLGDAYQLEFSGYFNRNPQVGGNKAFANYLSNQFEPVITSNKLNRPVQVKRTSDFNRPVKTIRGNEEMMLNYNDLKEGDIIYPEHNWSTTSDITGDVWGSGRPTSKVARINLPEGQSVFRPNMYKGTQYAAEEELVLPSKLGYKVSGINTQGFGNENPRFIFDVINPYKKGGLIKAQEGKEKSSKAPWENYDVITYKNNTDLVNSTANFDMLSKVPISPEYNEQIKHRLYTGNYGFNPKTGELVKLKSSERGQISSQDKQILKLQEQKKIEDQNKAIEEEHKVERLNSIVNAGYDPATFAGGYLPESAEYKDYFVTEGPRSFEELQKIPVEQWTKDEKNAWLDQGYYSTMFNPAFQTAALFTPVGAAIGSMNAIVNIPLDLYNKDYSTAALNALELIPGLRLFTKTVGKGVKTLRTGVSKTADNLLPSRIGNQRAFTVKGDIGKGTGTNLTTSDVQKTIDDQLKWITSEEYYKRRSANTGETYDQIFTDVNKTIKNAQDAKINVNATLPENIGGRQTPRSLNTLWGPPTVEVSRTTANPPMVLKHEVGHLYSPAGFDVPTSKLHRGFDNPNVASLPANKRGVYANYPKIGGDDMDEYLQLGYEQQVRHLNARDQILSKYNLDKEAPLTEDQVYDFVTNWNKKIQNREAGFSDAESNFHFGKEEDYDDIWLSERNQIKQQLKDKYNLNDPQKISQLSREEKNRLTEETNRLLSKKITDVLNKAWATVPVGIGVGIMAGEENSSKSVNQAPGGKFQFGGESEYQDLELTPEEIDWYLANGYEVEDID